MFFFFYNLAMRCGYNVGGIRVRPLLVLLLFYAAVPLYEVPRSLTHRRAASNCRDILPQIAY
jgi:hypothetical protein